MGRREAGTGKLDWLRETGASRLAIRCEKMDRCCSILDMGWCGSADGGSATGEAVITVVDSGTDGFEVIGSGVVVDGWLMVG